MEVQYSLYRSPLASYSSKEMLALHSDLNKYTIWRELWIWLAQSEQELGVEISKSQINEMMNYKTEINLVAAIAEEKQTNSEVLAHVNVYAKQCRIAGSFINLGASESYAIENANLIILKSSLNLLLPRLAVIIHDLKNFAELYKDLTTLAFIHLQPMQLTTVGKRACLWIQDLLFDELALRRCRDDLRFLGVKGIIGNQLSTLNMFRGEHEKVKKLNRKLAKLAGFEKLYLITGQTYSRKVEVEVLGALSGLGTTIHKICCDLKILALWRIIEESQNRGLRYPYKSERCCSLARYLISAYGHAAHAHATQWLEGTLDDSAIRRLSTPESFICADAVLSVFSELVQGFVVYPKLIERFNVDEMPFTLMNNLINAMVKAGVDRDACVAKVRAILGWGIVNLKQMGLRDDLVKTFKQDPYFEPVKDQFRWIFDQKTYLGRPSQQVIKFLDQEVNPVLIPYADKMRLFSLNK